MNIRRLKKKQQIFQKEKETEKKAPTNFVQVDRNLINPNDFRECAKNMRRMYLWNKKIFLDSVKMQPAKTHTERDREEEKKVEQPMKKQKINENKNNVRIL